MPACTVHLVLADRILDRWRGVPGSAPFRLSEPASLNAFFQGALGPDLGYLPGGHRLLSDLAHCVRSGDLTRILVDLARTPVERAFAWGWVTHVLADRAIHPLIGRATGELLHGDRDRLVDGSENPRAHIRVESGLDAVYSNRHPGVWHRRMAPVFDASSVRFLVEAYRAAYGCRIRSRHFLESHVRACRTYDRSLRATGLLGRGTNHRPVAGLVRTIRWFLRDGVAPLRGGREQDALFLAYIDPAWPTDWLLSAVRDEMDVLPERFARYYAEGLEELGNFNLENGRPWDPGSDHPNTRRALEGLRRLRARGDGRPDPGRIPAGAV